MRLKCLSLIHAVVLITLAAHAQETVLTPNNIFSIRTVSETAISPDGKFIAYTVTIPRPFSDAPGGDFRELHVLDRSSGQSTAVVTGKNFLSSISWKPGSQEVAFIANLGAPVLNRQVYTVDVSSKTPVAITSSSTDILQYEYSPIGTMLAYVTSDGPDPKRKELAAKGFNAEIYEENWKHRDLYTVDFSSGEMRQLTREMTVFDFAFSPDGQTIAAAIADRNLVDDSYMFKRVRSIDVATGHIETLADNPGKLGAMKWSPDGRHLAFISGVDVHDNKESSIFVTPVPGDIPFSELVNHTMDFEGHVIAIGWKDNNTLLYASEEGADITLREKKLNETKSRLLIKPGTVVFSSFDMQGDVLAFAGNTPAHPNELFTYTLKNNKLSRLTTSNEWLKNIRLGKQEDFRYKASDGLEITSVLIYPLNYQKGKRYPLITYIHGGPEAANQNGWVTNYGSWGQIAAAKDYFVFMPNYRASTGRGVNFARMGLGDLAGKEFDDVLDGIDALINQGMVDKAKVGIGGGSYGGYFAAWGATKHTDRFAASVVFVGVSNQISKRNTTDIPYEDYYVHWGIWTDEDFEKVYDRSPVKWAKNSKTPTLILHGKEDPRVHPSQSLELYRTLKLSGKAPVRLVWYPGEGHGNRRNPARLDYALRTIEWFDYYLKSDKPKHLMPASDLDYKVE